MERALPHTTPTYHLIITLFLFSFVLGTFSPCQAAPHKVRYDVLYLWNHDLNALLDYQEELEQLLGEESAAKLKVVAKDKEYGVIFDQDGSALTAAQIAIRHSELLRKAGLDEAIVVEDERYHELYNVSYGLGRNLEPLKKQFGLIYHYLGAEVGRNLFIEKTDSGNYTLIYRRRGDKKSTAQVARRHARLLRRKNIGASITPERNNLVVHGESSFLDDSEDHAAPSSAATPAKTAAAKPAVKRSQTKSPPKSIAPAHQLKKSKPAKSTAGTKLVSARETELERQLENFIKGLRRKGKLSRDERTGWLVYDLTSGKSLVDINVNNPLQAASMIKPFVALAFFHQVKHGKLIYGPKSKRMMTAMIQRSSNSATNWVMKQVGGPASVQRILKKRYGSIFEHTKIVEYIPTNGRTYRNTASPEDYGRFLRDLWQRKLPRGKEIRRLMALPGRDRLYYGTPIPQGTLVYNKTGSTAHLCGDMGILAPMGKDGRRYPYIIVGIIEKKSRPRSYGHWKMARSNVIRQVSSLVYKEMKGQYNLL